MVVLSFLECSVSQVGLFREDEAASQQEAIGFMLNSFEDGFGVFLPPAGTTPATLASVLLHFLVTLPEPLLTFKCVSSRDAHCQEARRPQTLITSNPAPWYGC